MLVEVGAWQGGEVSSTRQCNHVYRRQGRSVRWCEQDSSAGQSRSRSRSRLSRALKAETAGEAEAEWISRIIYAQLNVCRDHDVVLTCTKRTTLLPPVFSSLCSLFLVQCPLFSLHGAARGQATEHGAGGSDGTGSAGGLNRPNIISVSLSISLSVWRDIGGHVVHILLFICHRSACI